MLTKSLFRGAFGYLVRSVYGESSAKRDAASETVSEPLGDGAAMNAAATAASATPDPQPREAEPTDSKQFTPAADAETVPAALAPSLAETVPTSTAALVVDTSTSPAVPPPAQVVKVTPTSSRAKTAKSALGIPSGKKRKPKKKAPAPSHPSVGISVDALDKNKLWGPGRIVEVDVEEQRLLITFPGYNKNWDIWTDMLSIAPYGRYSHKPRKSARGWDGRTDLFTGERIGTEDDDGADEVVDRVQTSPRETPPAKPPVRKPKKGYVLELIPDDGVVAANTASPKQPPPLEKPRPASASLKRKVVKMEADTTTTVGPKQKKKARVAKPPPPVVREPYADADLTRQRAENQETLDKTAAFLTQCAALWKRQLSAMSDREQKALLGGGQQQGAADAVTGSVTVERESTVV